MSHPRQVPKGDHSGAGTTDGPGLAHSDAQGATPPHAAEARPARLGRRLLITRVAAGAALLAGGTLAAPRQAQAQYRTGLTDSDPNDSPGYGRGQRRPRTGLTDADPNDGAGYGRGGGRPRTGLTDSDPNDSPGHGRGGGGGRRHTGLTDADPNDGAGYGRGGSGRRHTGLTDSDPSDGAGQGRGGGRK